jgi:hypothetical protein
MTAKNRYWDHERCCWVTYEPTAATLPASLAAAVPEQRDDEPVQAVTPAE